MEIIINQSKVNFAHACLINNININLIIARERGNCSNCQKDKEISLISQRTLTQETRKYCQDCSTRVLSRLESYEIANKQQIIQELRTALDRQAVEIYNEKVYQRTKTREETRFYTFPNGKKIARTKCGCNLVGDNEIMNIYDWCHDDCQYFTSWRKNIYKYENEE